MALDGFALASIISELKETILGGRIDKVHQPEKDEIVLHIRSKGNTYKLLLTSNAGSPRLHFTNVAKENPLTAPLFCMVLRKHLMSGKIINITQPNFERIVNIHVESIDELGDYSEKILIFEIMGRHSNIILINSDNKVLESIKHVSFDMSSVRAISPNWEYTLPPNQNKKNPLLTNINEFGELIKNSEDLKLFKLYNGFSPIMVKEILNDANINEEDGITSLSNNDIENLYNSFDNIVELTKDNKFSNQIIYNDNDDIVDFTVFNYSIFNEYKKLEFDTISELLEYFYKSKDLAYRLNQKSSDLKKLISQNIERCIKKKDIQNQTLKDISDREELRLFGELITSNIYAIKKGMDKITLHNFYSENYEEIDIPLKTNLTPAENAQKYFKKYNKQKRTFVAMNEQIIQNDDELLYLESVLTSVQTCTDEKDIKEIRDELAEQGFLKKKKGKKERSTKKAKPLHYISSDGFNIYVGKNNTQNDELTLKFAKSLDMWLHTKNIAGSHVIIVADGRDISDTAINEAANLAVFYSKASKSTSVPVDYTPRKFVKKPNGSKPGMVIYETNKTAFITVNEKLIESLHFVD